MSEVEARIHKSFPPVAGTEQFSLDVHLNLHEKALAIVGPSGSGKSSVLHCIAGFLAPDRGRILIRDQICFDSESGVSLPPPARRCGYLFQDHSLFPHMNVRENIHFGAKHIKGRGRRELHRRVGELMEQFELSGLGSRMPSQLSGGEQQRAALARTLAADPQVLLLDEPSQGLDAAGRRSFYQVVQSTRKRSNIPSILVSHQMEECFELAETLAVLDNGKILQTGPRDSLFAKPASVAVARILGVFNIAEGTIQALDPGARTSVVRVFDQDLDADYFGGHFLGDRGYVCIRRWAMRLNRERSHGRNKLQLTTRAWQRTPAGIRVIFDHDFSVELTERELTGFEPADFAPNQQLTLEVPRDAVVFLPL